ncbi:hypothetical protein Taro_017437 [Colocasia esculenta]|uniref:Uncharacterized protein n=1 Tax=Colocasia esculenta TaxID=4460 RepID=A0A843UN55_COLES|nr:hypothetical protein [Colocasia esculenta]
MGGGVGVRILGCHLDPFGRDKVPVMTWLRRVPCRLPLCFSLCLNRGLRWSPRSLAVIATSSVSPPLPGCDGASVAFRWRQTVRRLLSLRGDMATCSSEFSASAATQFSWHRVVPSPRASVRGSSLDGGRAQVTDLEQKGKTCGALAVQTS